MCPPNDSSSSRPHRRWQRWAVRALIVPIKGYQWGISPLLGQRCRFWPSCSQYAIEALNVHGPIKGSVLALKRLGRCNPLFKGGIDPVPEPSPQKPHKPSRGSDS